MVGLGDIPEKLHCCRKTADLDSLDLESQWCIQKTLTKISWSLTSPNVNTIYNIPVEKSTLVVYLDEVLMPFVSV
jgi:hypothetical protein